MLNRTGLDLEHDDLFEVIQEIKAVTAPPENFTVSVPIFSIGQTNDHYDICQDLLDASYVIENLTASSTDTSIEFVTDRTIPYRHRIVLQCRGCKADFLQKVQLACIHFGGEDDNIRDEYSDYFDGYVEMMLNYVDDFEKGKRLTYPEIIDDYYANLVNGAYYTYEDEEWVQLQLEKFPERKVGYTKSPRNFEYGGEALSSHDGWVISKSIGLVEFFSSLDWQVQAKDFNPASFCVIGASCFASTSQVCVSIPTSVLQKAIFGRALASFGDNLSAHMSAMTLPRAKQKTGECQVLLSGEALVLEEGEWYFIFFDCDALSPPRRDQLKLQLIDLSLELSIFKDLEIESDLPWGRLSDDTFEALCYEIISRNPKFNRNTIRRMGAARSRDGGRDIVVWTNPTAPGSSPEKYVFQCKFTLKKRSLGKTAVPDIGDMLDQYEAQGFGIMTSVPIDATLYDSCDKICERRSVAQRHFSSHEISQELVRHPEIRHRFFGKEKSQLS